MKHLALLALGLLPCAAAHAEPTAPPQLLLARGGGLQATAEHGDVFYLSTGRTVTAWRQSAGTINALGDTRTQPLRGFIVALERHGDYLYAGYRAEPESGVAVYSLADPEQPVLLGSAQYHPGPYFALNTMRVIGQRLYVFDRYDGIFAADLAQPQNLTFQQVSTVSAPYDGVALVGDRLYFSGLDDFGFATVGAFDFSAPLSPLSLGNSLLGGAWNRINIAGNHAFAFGETLGVFDIADPANVKPVSTSTPLPTDLSLLLDGHAWNIDRDQIQVIDLTTPTQPVISATVPFVAGAGLPLLAQRSGTHALLGYESGDLQRLDATRPTTPTLTGAASLPSVTSVADIVFRGDRLFVPNYLSVHVLDRHSLVRLSRQNLLLNGQQAGAEAFTIEGDRAYFRRQDTIGVASIGSDDNLTVLGSWSVPQIQSAAVSGGILHAAHYDGAGEYRLAIVDLRDPAAPVQLASVPVPDMDHLVVQGTRLYAIDNPSAGQGELSIMDISTPQSPQLLGRVRTCFGFGLEVDARRALAAMHCLGNVQIVDVSDPTQPQLRALISAQYLRGTQMHGRSLYVSRADKLQEWDLSDPSQPQLLHELPIGSSRPRVSADAHLYLIANGIQVLKLDRLFADGLQR